MSMLTFFDIGSFLNTILFHFHNLKIVYYTFENIKV
jgi:hypothetical protein